MRPFHPVQCVSDIGAGTLAIKENSLVGEGKQMEGQPGPWKTLSLLLLLMEDLAPGVWVEEGHAPVT